MDASRRVGEEDMVVMRYDLRTSGRVRHDSGGAWEGVVMGCGGGMLLLVVMGSVTPFLSCEVECSCCARICVVVAL